jgi:AcrR family transcriptional regulator
MSAPQDSALFDQSGRPLGPRAQETRRRLLDETRAELALRPLRELSVVEIARRAGTSPATFYQYFKDLTEAALCLAREVELGMPAVVAAVDGPWDEARGPTTAREVVRAFVALWDAHHAVLLLRNLASDQGDERFRRVRIDSQRALLRRIAERIDASVRAGELPRDTQSLAAAAAMVSLLERVAAHQRGLEPFGVSRDAFLETTARILYQTVTGRVARGA